MIHRYEITWMDRMNRMKTKNRTNAHYSGAKPMDPYLGGLQNISLTNQFRNS